MCIHRIIFLWVVCVILILRQIWLIGVFMCYVIWKQNSLLTDDSSQSLIFILEESNIRCCWWLKINSKQDIAISSHSFWRNKSLGSQLLSVRKESGERKGVSDKASEVLSVIFKSLNTHRTEMWIPQLWREIQYYVDYWLWDSSRKRIFFLLYIEILGLECSSVTEHLLSMCKALGLVPNTGGGRRKRKEWKKCSTYGKPVICSIFSIQNVYRIGHMKLPTYDYDMQHGTFMWIHIMHICTHIKL